MATGRQRAANKRKCDIRMRSKANLTRNKYKNKFNKSGSNGYGKNS
jgi:hypothetical protein